MNQKNFLDELKREAGEDSLKREIFSIGSEIAMESDAESIQYEMNNDLQMSLSNIIGNESANRVMAQGMTLKELVTLFPSVIFHDVVEGYKVALYQYADFVRDVFTLSHIRGFVKVIADIENDNKITSSQRDRLTRYMETGSLLSGSKVIPLFFYASLSLGKYRHFIEQAPTKPSFMIVPIKSNDMVGCKYLSLDTSGFNIQMKKRAEEFVYDFAKRMLASSQRKGIEYGVELKAGVLKSPLNKNVLEAVVYAPIELID